MNNIVEVEYTGIVSVCCDRCDTCFNLNFSGNEMTLDDAIDEALEEDGWFNGVCPICLDSRNNENTDNDPEDY